MKRREVLTSNEVWSKGSLRLQLSPSSGSDLPSVVFTLRFYVKGIWLPRAPGIYPPGFKSNRKQDFSFTTVMLFSLECDIQWLEFVCKFILQLIMVTREMPCFNWSRLSDLPSRGWSQHLPESQWTEVEKMGDSSGGKTRKPIKVLLPEEKKKWFKNKYNRGINTV